INIQDLHCNYPAQKNIAKILDHLCTTYGIRLISVEGGSGKIDTTFYKDLPDEKIKEQVADYFLREARINGTEYFAITTKRDIALYGAEDAVYYDKNLEAFLKALPERERILEAIAMLENNLNIIKSKIYNKKLNELDDNIVAYDNGELPFESYILYLAEQYPAAKLKQEFAEVNQLLEAIRLKDKLSIEKAEAERKELIDYLSKGLARKDLEEFLKATVEFKAKTMDAVTYHNTLKKLYDGMEKKAKALDRAWPQLSKYIEYLNKHETLDKFGLFSELDSLLERIKNGLYTTYTQKMLDHNLKVIRLARNLYSTKLLNRDLTQVKKYEGDFKAQKFRAYVEREAKRLKLELALPRQEDMEAMEKTLPDLKNFYYYASQRDNILAANTLSGMTQEKESVGALVTGGFHTDGIAQYLKEKRVSYVVICPVIDKLEDNDERYINALQGKKTPFEEQLEREEKLAKQQ
ncbi:MAG: hypothetical protein KKH34_11930, partial [Candidatus Omnitrophica bacterium]|nr:hypothetical protein [Candidatus Omnitrophota bacterium]